MIYGTPAIPVIPVISVILVIPVNLTRARAMVPDTRTPSRLAPRTLLTTALPQLFPRHPSSSRRSHPRRTLPCPLLPSRSSRHTFLTPRLFLLAIHLPCHLHPRQRSVLLTHLLQASRWAVAPACASRLVLPDSPSTSTRSALLSSQLPPVSRLAPLLRLEQLEPLPLLPVLTSAL